MKKCDHCKMQIPNDATTCPYCQKDPDEYTRKNLESASEGFYILIEKMKSLTYWILWIISSILWWGISISNVWSNELFIGIIFGLLTAVFIHELFEKFKLK